MTSVEQERARPDCGGPEASLLTRPFVMVTAVTFLFFVYVGVLVPLVPRLIEEDLGGTEVDIGINLAVFSLAAIAIRPWIGRWGDRYGRRVLLIGGGTVAALAALGATLVTDRFALLPLRGLMGAGEGALFVGAATMINDLAPAHRRAEATSYFSVAVFGGIGVGPILGEEISRGGRFDRGLVLAAVFGLASAVAALLLRDDRPRIVGPPADVGAPPRSRTGFHRAAVRPGIVLACGIAAFVAFNAFVPEHARTVGLEGSMWVFALYSGVCLVVRIVGARVPERIGLARAGSIALVNLAAGFVLLAAVATPFGLFAGTFVIAIGMSFLYPALSAIAVNTGPTEARSQVVSTFTMFFEIGTVAGGIALGVVAELAGKRGGFGGAAVVSLVGLVVLWRVLLPGAAAAAQPSSEPSETRQ